MSISTPTPTQLAGANLVALTQYNGKPIRMWDSVHKNFPPTIVYVTPAVIPTPPPVAITYTVTYESPSGTVSGGSFAAGDKITVAAAPTMPAGDTFTSWGDGLHAYSPGSSYTMPANNVVFIAIYSVVTPPTPTPTPTPSNAGPSGVAVPKPGDVPGWTLLIADGFDWSCPTGSFPNSGNLGGGNAMSGKSAWTSYPSSYKDTSKNGTYHSDTVLSVHDSVLDYYLHTDSSGVPNVACAIPLLNGPGREGGYVNIRTMSVFKVDASLEVSLPGYKMANLLWPDSEKWPGDGEIDCPECDLNGSINIFMHRQNGSSGGDQDYYSTGIMLGVGWHTVIVEKTANYCKFTVDGFTATSTSRVPNTPMNWRIQNESNLNGQKPDASVAGHIEYDLAAVWTQ